VIDEVDEAVAVGDVAGAIEERVLPLDEIEGRACGEIAGVDCGPTPGFRRQLGRRADEYGDLMPGCQRQAQHVAAERPGRAEDDYA
jgi:hypothetical protein